MGLCRLVLPTLSLLVMAPSVAFGQPKTEVTLPAAVNLLPPDTAGVLLINTQDQDWAQLSRFGLFPADFAFPGSFLPLGINVDFHTDIQPWLGNHVAIAYLPLTDTDKTSINNGVLIAPIKDASSIPAFLEKIKASRAEAPNEIQYQGVTILEWIDVAKSEMPEEAPEETPTQGETQTQNPDSGKKIAAAKKGPLKSRLDMISKGNAKDEKKLIINGLKPVPLMAVAASPSPSQVTPEEKPEEKLEEKPEAPLEEKPEAPLEVIPTEKPTVSEEVRGLAIAVLPSGYLVSANSAQPIQRLIDTQSAPEHLGNYPAFKRTAANPNFGRSLIVGYGNYAQIFKAATTIDRPSSTPFPSPFSMFGLGSEADLVSLIDKVYDNVDGYLWVQPEGVRMQIGIGFKQTIPPPFIEALRTPNQIIQRLPEVTYMTSNGKDVSLFWKLAVTILEANPKLRLGLDNFRKTSQQYAGFDDRDIFPWMNGEYVSFVYPTKQGWIPATFPNFDLGVGVALQTRDRPAAEAAMKKLDQFVKKQSRPAIKVVDQAVKGQAVTSWNMLDDKQKPQSLLSRNWVSDDTLLFLTGTSATAELSPKPFRALPQSTNFQAAIAPLPTDNIGYSYVNMGATLSFVNTTLLPLIFGKKAANSPVLDSYKTMIGSIRSLSSTTSIESDKVKSDAFVALATTRPQPITAAELIELGQQKVSDGNFSWAIGNFSRALQLDPENIEAYSQRGAARAANTDQAGAIADFSQVIARDPQNGAAYSQRGLAKEAMFDAAGANQDYTQSITLQPDNPETYLLRSSVRITLADYPGAIADTTQLIKLEPSNSAAFNNRCYARARGLGDFRTALADCNKAIDLEGEFPSATHLASRCYVRAYLKDENGLADCERALQTDPEYGGSPAFLEDRGLARMALGDNVGAREDWQQALDLTSPKDQINIERLEKLLQSLPNTK